MKNIDFASGYNAVLTPQQIHPGTYSQAILDAQDWSYAYGSALHGHLSEQETPIIGAPNPVKYLSWMANQEIDIRLRPTANDSPEDSARILNENNFHSLNTAMLSMWKPLLGEVWRTPEHRIRAINQSRDNIAIQGMICYTVRQNYIKQLGSPALFKEENHPFHQAVNGAIQEFDSALVLLDAVKKHPDWIVLPSPMQFERSKHSERNADFIVIDQAAKQSIGVQVKSSVRDETAARYDPDWVVLIDGNADFNNVLALRTRHNSSSKKVVSWAGILSAHHAANISTKNRPMSPAERTSIMRTKLIAKTALQNITVKDYPAIVSRINERISAKLTTEQ